MGNSHTKRKRRAARMQAFAEQVKKVPDEYEVTQHTKYHYSFQRLTAGGFLTDPVQAYPTTLRVVTFEGETIDCLTIGDMFAQIKTELYREA